MGMCFTCCRSGIELPKLLLVSYTSVMSFILRVCFRKIV